MRQRAQRQQVEVALAVQRRRRQRRADVERQQVVVQHRAAAQQQPPLVGLYTLNLVGQPARTCGGDQRRKVDADLVIPIVPRQPARHHAGVRRQRVGADQQQLHAGWWRALPGLEQQRMGVAGARQHQALHGRMAAMAWADLTVPALPHCKPAN